MNTMRKKLLALLIVPFICSLFCVAAFPSSVSAAPNNGGNNGGNAGIGGGNAISGGQPDHCNGNNNCDLVRLYVNPFIKLLTIVVGLVVAASLILGGIQYTASTGDPQKTSAAKSRITNTLLAFLAYAFLFAFLNFLIPGGVF